MRPLSGIASGTMLGTFAVLGVLYSSQGIDGRANCEDCGCGYGILQGTKKAICL